MTQYDSGRTPVRPFLIAGRWQMEGAVQLVRRPSDGTPIAEVAQAGKAEADDALDQALGATGPMRRLSSHERATALNRIVSGMEARREEFARSIVDEAGKPITDARREVGRAIQTFRIAAEETKRIPGDAISLDLAPGTERYLGVLRRFPVGVVLGITPFNFPLNLVAHKVGPCLAAGNPIVLKPAPQTPLTALLLGELVLDAGLPPGACSILPCRNETAELMVTDDRPRVVSFTGSAPVGWMLKSKAGKKRVVLELGGNAGVVVEADGDLDHAVDRCVAGGFTYAGQSCISVQRIFVQAGVYERFLDHLVSRVQALPVGDPHDERTVVGPLIDEAAAQRVASWIEEAVTQGAHVATGGKRSGSFVEPTVLTDVDTQMTISRCEAFGPVVTVTPYHHFEEALDLLNDSEYGLQAGVFTQDVNRIFYAYEKLEVGAVLTNEVPTFRADHMPYGGVKASGLGREGVRYAIEELTEPKLLVLTPRF